MKSKNAGFTLIELMIVVVIIAVLASIAYPTYTRHTVRARRAAAAGCLLERSQFAERYYTTHMGYDGLAITDTGCVTQLNTYYSFPAPSDVSPTTFTLSAVPQGAQQAKETYCGTMTIDQKSAKTATGSWSGTPEKCF